MQARPQEGIEMSLREHLMAASTSGSGPSPYPSVSAGTASNHPYPPSDSDSPHNHHLDPNVTGQSGPYPMSGDSQLDDGSGKGKRELSTSKRAAQNRAAQRAFRQRKEGYIKKLEEQVKEFQNMEQNYKALQNENYQLREYILGLQSRLLENQADFPPAPSHVNLSAPSHSSAEPPSYAAEQQLRREMDQQNQQRPPPAAPVTAREDPRDGMAQLQQAAAAASEHTSPYGMGSRDYPSKPPHTDGSNHDAKPTS